MKVKISIAQTINIIPNLISNHALHHLHKTIVIRSPGIIIIIIIIIIIHSNLFSHSFLSLFHFSLWFLIKRKKTQRNRNSLLLSLFLRTLFLDRVVPPERRGAFSVWWCRRRLLHRATAPEGGVPVILDGVIGAARKEARDGSPFVSVNSVRLDDDLVLRRREGTVLHLWTQLVAPSQPAGLARAAGNAAADEGPIPRAVFVHQF